MRVPLPPTWTVSNRRTTRHGALHVDPCEHARQAYALHDAAGVRKQGALGASLHGFVDELRQYLISTRDASTAESGAREDHIAASLALVTELADMLASGLSVAHVEELSRSRLRSQMTSWTDSSPALAELSAVRAAALDLWLRADSAARGDVKVLKTLHVAIDIVIAAAATEAESRKHANPNAAERELALGELESLLAASPVGIAFLDPALRYVRINEALAAINGSSAAAHIGRSIMEMLPNEAHVIEPMLRDVIAAGRPVMNRELTRARPEDPGELRSYLATFFPVRARSGEIIGVGGLVSDITDARRAEQDLRRTQERMQSILAHTPASIWLKDEGGRIVLANQQLADALGHPYEQIIGRRSEDLLPPALAAEHRAHDLAVAREHRAIEVEEEVPAPEGVRTFLSIPIGLGQTHGTALASVSISRVASSHVTEERSACTVPSAQVHGSHLPFLPLKPGRR